MIDDGLPLGEELAEVEVWGNPYHGLVSGGVLTLPNAAERAWTQPDSGDCILVKVPGVPAVVRDEAAQALDTANGHQWRDYALMSGWWNRQLYGQDMKFGPRSYVWSLGPGQAYLVSAAGVQLGNVVEGGVTVAKLGGNITLHSTCFGAGITEQQVEVTPVAVPMFKPDSGTGELAARLDIVSIRPDGGRVLIGLWPATTPTHQSDWSGETVTYQAVQGCRGLARVEWTMNSGIGGWPVGTYTARAAPYAYIALDLGIAEDGTPVATMSPYLNWSDVALDNEVTPDSPYDFYVVENSSSQGAALPQCPGGTHIAYETSDYVYHWRTEALIGVSWTEAGVERRIKMVWDSILHTTSATEFTGSCGSGQPAYVSSGTETVTEEVRLVVDGVACSTIQATWAIATTAAVDMYGTLVSSSRSDTSSVSLDGTVLDSGTTTHYWLNAEIGYALRATTLMSLQGKPFGATTTTDLVAIHAVRYSNNAYGFVLVPHVGDLLASPYRMGIVNVVDGSRTAAPGIYSPGFGTDPIDHVYTGLDQVSVEPVSGALARQATACFV